MPGGKCVFNTKWLDQYSWVREVKGLRSKASCAFCRREIDLGKMGETALKSHEKSARHQSASKTLPKTTVSSFFTMTPKDENNNEYKNPENTGASGDSSDLQPEKMTVPHPPQMKPPVGISRYLQQSDVTKAEILWTIQTVISHNSYKSNENIKQLFKEMFPDSNIVEKFSCGERKTSYLCCFGIADHIRKLLLQEIDGYYVILFDESLNKKAQSKQMDLHVRFWSKAKVQSRYLTSQFLGHGTAENMLEHFFKGLGDLQKQVKNLLQVSMDGPSVNWKFWDLISKQLEKDYSVNLINIGSCGLHIVHNAFKTGCQATGWDISSVLSSLYYLFKDSPARKEDYQQNCSSTIMPLKFVTHRWMENVSVADRAIIVWDNVGKYVKDVEKKKIAKPSCKSFEIVQAATKDRLIRAKLEFFRCIAMHLQAFLGNFQTDRPMVPFLYNELTKIIRSLMERIIKRDVLIKATGVKLLRIDLDDSSCFNEHSKIDIGFSAEKALKESVKEHKITERQVLEFRLQCRDFIVKLLKKLLEKSPATYYLVRCLSFLDPRQIVGNEENCKEKLKKVLTQLVAHNRLSDRDCDECVKQYSEFMDNIPAIGTSKFQNFNMQKERLDEFYSQHMVGEAYKKILDVVKLLMILSHGQATVERGFSVNKEVEVENLKEHSLIAQRLICDYVSNVGGILNVPISKELIGSCLAARSKMDNYVAKQRELKKTDGQKRKRDELLQEIEQLKQQSKQAKLDIESLNKTADEYSLKAEKESNLSYIAHSNSLRQKAKDKCSVSAKLDKKLEEKVQKLKEC